jgi:type II secretory pathway pseudopilin PulG
MRRQHGFTLLEALLSFSLFLLVLSLVAQGLSQLAQVTKYFDGKSQAFGLATNTLERLAIDAREANRIRLPLAGDLNTYNQFHLDKVEPARWPTYFPASPPTPWNPRDASVQEQLDYSLAADRLECSLTTATGTQVEVVAVGIQGFTVRRVQPLCLEIRLSLLINDNLASFTRQLWLPQILGRVHP